MFHVILDSTKYFSKFYKILLQIIGNSCAETLDFKNFPRAIHVSMWILLNGLDVNI